ncbi:unnamed protein product [Leuciscus chuanchicus]
MNGLNKTCAEIQTDGGFEYRLQSNILNLTNIPDCDQSWYSEDGRVIADPSDPEKLMDPVISVSSDRLVTSRCVEELHHEIQCHSSGFSMETLFRVRNETAATPNSDVNEVTPSLQISDQLWWLFALFIFIIFICFILRKRIFRCFQRFLCQTDDDSDNRCQRVQYCHLRGQPGISSSDILYIVDNFDRPGGASAERTYAGTGTFASAFENKPGKRVPKAGAYAEAGVGRASAAYSVFEAQAKGPNATARADANLIKAGAVARAEVGSASAKASPIGVKVGLGVDTGASVGADGLEVKVLGTGFTIGPKLGVSILGSEVSCCVM